MLRVSQYMRALASGAPLGPARKPAGPVVIWNLTRRCNLTCQHCYANASDRPFAGELATNEALAVLDQLHAAQVPAVILSGGEPLLRPDLFALATYARQLGLHVSLSTNGTLIDEPIAAWIAATGFDYVGISLDGIGDTHDRFRRSPGAYLAATRGLMRLRDLGVRTGVRFTLTEDNAQDLAPLLDEQVAAGIPRFYLSHLNYAGRGHVNRARDAFMTTTREALDLLFARAWEAAVSGAPLELVTGNNDADGVYLLRWVEERMPEHLPLLSELLRRWGGNATGLYVANIDHLGQVHPDTMWWQHTLGNVRERSFGEIWADTSDPLMAGLKANPRPLEGRCAGCPHRAICNGNTRMRALQLTGNPWAEDPGCYLTDAELGLAATTA